MKAMQECKKAIIVSAPSGAGKTSIVRHLLEHFSHLAFSVSACSRAPRGDELDGKDYYFITSDTFREKISRDEFAEWEEVYPGSFYGTLKSELDRIWESGKIPIFDVDVKGGLNLKKYFGEKALAVFIQPPSVEILASRLKNRGTESEDSFRKRIQKAELELSYAPRFDRIIVNDDLEQSFMTAIEMVKLFLK